MQNKTSCLLLEGSKMQSAVYIFDKLDTSHCSTCEYRKLRIFCDLSPEPLADFDAISEVFHYPRGTLLFREGNIPQAVHVVCSGQIKIFCSSEDGKTLILKIAGPGDLLGLSAVISDSPYEASAETLEPTMLQRVRKREFLSFMGKHSECGLHAAKMLAQDYQAVLANARRLALTGSAAGKVAHVLLEWGRAVSPFEPDHGITGQMRFTMALTHEELANMAGTSRETVTRLLSQFKRDGIITTQGSRLTICKPKTLKALIV
ncbi:MAG: Crp/Fnr family transcriptional regulator [Acidobacteriaceae bacterium]